MGSDNWEASDLTFQKTVKSISAAVSSEVKQA